MQTSRTSFARPENIVKGEASEADIQRTILDYLKLHKIVHWRNQSGAWKVGKRYVRFGAVGSPDIFAVVQGTIFGIEVKKPGESQSKQQQAWEIMFLDAGGRYILAYSLEDVIEGLK
jgi:hypothetical protein